MCWKFFVLFDCRFVIMMAVEVDAAMLLILLVLVFCVCSTAGNLGNRCSPGFAQIHIMIWLPIEKGGGPIRIGKKKGYFCNLGRM